MSTSTFSRHPKSHPHGIFAACTLAGLVSVGLAPAQAAPADVDPNATVVGGIAAKYYANGGEKTYGKPSTNERIDGQSRTPGAVSQSFEKGTMYWTEATGAYFVQADSGVGIEYSNQFLYAHSDPAHPWIGVPVDDGFLAAGEPGFEGQNFTDGAIFYNEVTGAHTVYGGVHEFWRYGGVRLADGSALYNLIPVTGEQPLGTGVRQSFASPGSSHGNIFWSPSTGAHFVEAGTLAGDYYSSHGAVDAFGFPTSEVTDQGGVSTLQTEKGVLTVAGGEALFVPRG